MTVHLKLTFSFFLLFIATAYCQRSFVHSCKCVPLHLCNDESEALTPRQVSVEIRCGDDEICCSPRNLIPSNKPKPKPKSKPKPKPNVEYEEESSSTYEDESLNKNTEEYPTKTDERTLKPHAPKCGVIPENPLVRRLISSEAESYALAHEIPWQVAILKDEARSYIYHCSGALVSDRKVVTTAHNLEGLAPNSIKVRLGEHDLSREDESSWGSVDATVEEVHLHPEFNSKRMSHDVAVICIKPQQFSRHITPICLPRNSKQNFQDRPCVVGGWGKDSLDGQYSSQLKRIDLRLVSRSRCIDLLEANNIRNFNLHSTLLCAGGKHREDTCVGDGGAPLSCRDADGSMYLTGLVNSGFGCGQKEVPGLYTNVPSLVDWINSIECGGSTSSEKYKPKSPTSGRPKSNPSYNPKHSWEDKETQETEEDDSYDVYN